MKPQLIKSAILFGIVGIAACANTDEEVSPDGRDDVALVDGKADNQFGVCGEDKLLALLNDPLIDLAHLKGHGVHSRAASNLINTRNGADKLAGTPDDTIFESLVQIDRVPYVGKAAMTQLASLVEHLCVAPSNSRNEIIFSPQPIGESHVARVAELIDEAEVSADIAVYSFSDAGVTSAIERAIGRGVSIRMVFEPARDERNDPDGSKSDQLERLGVDVRYINKIMHHKFAIIDGPREVLSQTASGAGVLITGSANWSSSAATRFDENTVITHGNTELNLAFQREFNHMWAHSRDFDNGAGHDFFESDSIDESMIPDDPSVKVAFTSDNFRTYTSSAHGETFSVVRGLNTVADAIVEEINNAQSSIWIASGHMRSRPIAEALLAKRAADPTLDIKIYLDGQEYVSDYVHNDQLANREACLVTAGTNEAKIEACLDKSYHYSWDLDASDIELRFKYYAYRWHYSYADQMHHKYMIVDGNRVLSGSYNYSDNAEHNTLENMVVYDESGFPGIVAKYQENFLNIWQTGEGLYDPLLDEVKTADRVSLVFDAMAISKTQIQELKSAISSNCPDANSSAFRQAPERNQTCYK